MSRLTLLSSLSLLSLLAACGPAEDEDQNHENPSNHENHENHENHTSPALVVPTTYTFESRFEPGTSSVSYSGQTMRQLLISDLNAYIGGQLEMDALTNTNLTSQADFLSTLTFYADFDSDADGATPLLTTTTPDAKQMTFADVSSGKFLFEKLAGNDTKTDHKDWSVAYQGWQDASIASQGGDVTSPEGLIRAFMNTLAAQAFDLSQGTAIQDPTDPSKTLPVHVTASGLDLQQLIQKSLLMGVTFSQGTDDYLDSDLDGKGLLASNARDEDNPYSSLEHAWDEGFGYFGAARDYADYTDAQIAAGELRDSDGDGAIDFTSEYNFAASVNAAKRDQGSKTPTDFTAQAFEAFLTGRAIIRSAGDTLTPQQLEDLTAQRDLAVDAWEKAIAATVIHYVNDTLQAMATFGSSNYDFPSHAKVWSELKGFSLGLQFNPRSPMLTGDRFSSFHDLIKDAPVLPDASQEDILAYKADLRAARDIIAQAYGFDAANVGDDSGESGW